MDCPDKMSRFPATWVEVLALEYAKAHISESDSPVDFANLYIDAANQIREALAKTYRKSKD